MYKYHKMKKTVILSFLILFFSIEHKILEYELKASNQQYMKPTKWSTLLKLHNQTSQTQNTSGDSSNIISNKNLLSRLIDRLSQIFCDGNAMHTYGHDGPFSMF